MKIYTLLENANLFNSTYLREKIQFFVIKNIMLKISKLKDLVGCTVRAIYFLLG